MEFSNDFKATISETLLPLSDRARTCHNWTSFDPEKRGKQLIDGYTSLLLESVEEMLEKGVSEGMCLWYAGKYKALFSAWISRKANCASSAITGGSGFNVRRAEKANKSEHAANDIFHHWQESMMKKLIRQAQPHKTNDSEILRLRTKVEQMESDQRIMKRLNNLYPKYLKFMKNPEANPLAFADMHGISVSQLNAIRNHVPSYNTKTKVFPSFMLTNNNARIKNTKESILKLEQREAAKNSEVKVLQFDFEGGRVEISYESERINVYHDEKPSSEVISTIKRAGFRWSPSFKSWTRQLTDNALYSARFAFPDLNLPKRAY